MVWLGLRDLFGNVVATRYVDDHVQVLEFAKMAAVLCAIDAKFLGVTMGHRVWTDIGYPDEIHSKPLDLCGEDQVHHLLAMGPTTHNGYVEDLILLHSSLLGRSNIHKNPAAVSYEARR
jgi:hypothetical protein